MPLSPRAKERSLTTSNPCFKRTQPLKARDFVESPDSDRLAVPPGKLSTDGISG